MSNNTLHFSEDSQPHIAEAAKREEFEADAEKRYAKIIATGETIPWADMRNYLATKMTGKKTAPPNSHRRLG